MRANPKYSPVFLDYKQYRYGRIDATTLAVETSIGFSPKNESSPAFTAAGNDVGNAPTSHIEG